MVLSACQTGLGSIVRGEGTISLARGFLYAGTSSVITSLWNVREKSNMHIVLAFYHALKKGKTKDEALREAKLEYLFSISKENQEKAHPYYWAPMICVGDISAYKASSPDLKVPVFLVLLILVSSTIFIFYKRKHQLKS